jgi:hypothetical protein
MVKKHARTISDGISSIILQGVNLAYKMLRIICIHFLPIQFDNFYNPFINLSSTPSRIFYMYRDAFDKKLMVRLLGYPQPST